MTGHTCPECGGSQDSGIRPGCACGARTAQLTGEERRSARSAEAAAAEDFDPLRIRPYVTLAGGAADSSADAVEVPDGEAATGPFPGAGEGAGGGVRAVPGEASGGHATGAEGAAPDAAATMPLFLTGVAAGPVPDAIAGDETRRRRVGAYAGGGPDPVQPRRRRPFAALTAGVAVAAVVGTAAFVGGLFGGDDAGLDEALPETTAADTSGEPARSVSQSPSASPSPSRSASASPSPSVSASPSRSPEVSRSASASPSARDTPSPTASRTPSATPPAPASGPTLRRGDHGDEVEELQRRLQELWLYRGPADGDYTDRVENGVRDFQSYMAIEGDPAGVYGPETRRALEERTSGDGDGDDRHGR